MSPYRCRASARRDKPLPHRPSRVDRDANRASGVHSPSNRELLRETYAPHTPLFPHWLPVATAPPTLRPRFLNPAFRGLSRQIGAPHRCAPLREGERICCPGGPGAQPRSVGFWHGGSINSFSRLLRPEAALVDIGLIAALGKPVP